MQDRHDLGLIIDSRVPIIVLESHEEPQAVDMLVRLAKERDKPLFIWTITDGLRRSGIGLQLEDSAKHKDAEELLSYIKNRAEPGFYVLCDFHPWLEDDPKIVRLLKDIALRNSRGQITLIFISHRLQLPPELIRLSALFQMSLPNDEEIMRLVRDEAKQWAQRNQGQKVKTDNRTLQQLVNNLKGLTNGEVRHLVRGAIVHDGAISDSDLPEINKAKFKLMDLDGVLSYEYDTEKFADVGGMQNLKHWLQLRRDVFNGAQAPAGIVPPKGILLLGVQGGGKSLAAKAVAGMWNVPLLRLDLAALYNKFYGETERNLRESLALAEKMAPCVLWMDELEKGISIDSGEGGPSQRILGTLLTWLAEKSSNVFVVATANNIQKLPPELVRKGRFDELFFVDLPDAETRKIIFDIHLKKRDINTAEFDLTTLSAASEGFTGAEIEQAIVAATYSAMATNDVLNQHVLLKELCTTVPLSGVMAEDLARLRLWAQERKLVMV